MVTLITPDYPNTLAVSCVQGRDLFPRGVFSTFHHPSVLDLPSAFTSEKVWLHTVATPPRVFNWDLLLGNCRLGKRGGMQASTLLNTQCQTFIVPLGLEYVICSVATPPCSSRPGKNIYLCFPQRYRIFFYSLVMDAKAFYHYPSLHTNEGFCFIEDVGKKCPGRVLDILQ